MRINSVIILLFVGIITASAQNNNIDKQLTHRPIPIPLDSSFVECIYNYYVYDPVLDENKSDSKILEIGNNFSKYSDYGAYQLDSLLETDYPLGLTRLQFRNLYISHLPSWEANIKDFTNNITSTNDRVFSESIIYEEPTPFFNWELQPDTVFILGHLCHKASTKFRGRDWTVWYTSDIPLNNGPWKFGGLPGLILKAESKDKEHKFEAVSLRNTKRLIGKQKFAYQTTTREKFNQDMKAYKTQPRQFLNGNPLAPKDKDGNIIGSEFRRLFFNPIELE